jgi:RNA polymerase sigma factor (sigma-70 family)
LTALPQWAIVGCVAQANDELDDGARLAACAPRLALLLEHLAGPAIQRRIELEDLVQETFLRALAHPGGLPPREPGEAGLWRFLVVLARHAVIDAARAARAAKRDGREERLSRTGWSAVGVRESRLAAAATGACTRAAMAEEGGRLRVAFERLAPEHRRVLGLRQFEGLSARETGRRMGRGESAVHSLYRRALQAWEAELARER